MISCKTVTYGRVSTLEETLYSFLNQDYKKERELIIVNDYPLQKLIYYHPQVKIFNLDKTFETIGEKENFAVNQCKGDLIAVFDDDDIALSNHLSNIDKYMEDADLLHWGHGVYFNSGKVTDIVNVGNSGIVYKKSIWEKVGRHPLENAGYDTTFVNNIRATGAKVINAYPPKEETSWFYYWGGRSYHQSGMGTDDGTRPNIIQRHSEYIEEERKKGNIPTGDIVLKPHWKQPYDKLLKEFVRKTK